MGDEITEEMVQRFLSWPLPNDVCADAVACKQGAPHRTGTNLLTATQARQMIEHVFWPAISAERNALRGERDRLREAIERAIKHEPHDDMCEAVIDVPGDEHPQDERCDCYKVRLRDALEGKP